MKRYRKVYFAVGFYLACAWLTHIYTIKVARACEAEHSSSFIACESEELAADIVWVLWPLYWFVHSSYEAAGTS